MGWRETWVAELKAKSKKGHEAKNSVLTLRLLSCVTVGRLLQASASCSVKKELL